ncbi:MAG: hypothetical protein WA941_06830 [Nitrososphaeraceae archaeon]
MQIILNKREKEQLVIKLHQEGKTIRETAQQVHMSFKDIGTIIRRIDGQEDHDIETKDLKNKSKETRALYLFLHGKRPVDVAIELDLSSSEVENILQEFWVLNKLDELACVYLEIRNHIELFLRLFHIMKKNKLINQEDIKTVLKYANDLPSLENRFHDLANIVLDLEIKKKELNAQLLDLEHIICQYQNAIHMNGKRLSEMEAYMSQPAIRYDKSKPGKVSK